MTTNYRRGATLEYAIKTHLQTEGYDVFRSAGSHGTVDLIAIKPGQILLIQAKLDGKIGPFARHRLIQLASHINQAIPIVAYKIRGTLNPQYDRLDHGDTRHPFTLDYAEDAP